MRTISATSLAKIGEQYGTEPIIIVRVWWNDIAYDYSDKIVLDQGVFGRILSVSGLDDISNLSSNVQTISVTLDDSDEQLKQIIDYIDVHKKRVQVLQWFNGIPKSEAFVLFEGQINSPIEWSEGARTLSFDVVSQIEAFELGFSMEEGYYTNLPIKAIGEPFPMIFGTAIKSRALQMTDVPTAILALGKGDVDEVQYTAELNELKASQEDLRISFRESLAAAIFNLLKAGEAINEGDFELANEYLAVYGKLIQQANTYLNEVRFLEEKIGLLQKEYDDRLGVSFQAPGGENRFFSIVTDIPLPTSFQFEINGSYYEGIYDETTLRIKVGNEVTFDTARPKTVFFNKVNFRQVSTSYDSAPQVERFRWYDAGTQIRIINVPIYYIVGIGNCTVSVVYGKINGVRVPIPPQYYEIKYISFGTLTATCIKTFRPISTILSPIGEKVWDSDDIWCDVTSGTTSDNFISILKYVIDNFTNLDYDNTSFTAVDAQTSNARMNFVLYERKNTLDFIKELAFQAKCTVWIDNLTVKIRYLPAVPTYVDEITSDHIIEDSLVISAGVTEDLVTKLVALWQRDYSQEKPNKFIVRNNVERYGLLEQVFDYYAYNNAEAVKSSAIYWSIRLSNTWKVLKFRSLVDKLKLESNDPVLMVNDTNLFALEDVIGIVTSAVYDSDSQEISFEVWLPVLWGTMYTYKWAYPQLVTETYSKSRPDFKTGNPFQGATGATELLQSVVPLLTTQFAKSTIDTSTDQPINDQPIDSSVNVRLASVAVNLQRPEDFALTNAKTQYNPKPPEIFEVTDTPTSTSVGWIVDGEGQFYTVETVDNKIYKDVRQLEIADGYRLSPGTPVTIVKINKKWYMTAPVWVEE